MTAATTPAQPDEVVRAEEPELNAKPTSPVLEGLRVELRRLIDDDLDANLTQIEQLARVGRELMMVLKAPEARLLNRRPAPPAISSYGYSTGTAVNVVGSAGSGTFPGAAQEALFSPEQYGATSIRQLTSLVPDAIDKIVRAFSQGPQRIVAAIIAARAAGHDGLADKLEERLLKEHEDEHEELPPPPPAHVHTNGVVVPSQPAPQTAE